MNTNTDMHFYFTEFMILIPFLLSIPVRFFKDQRVKGRLTLLAPVFIIAITLFDYFFTHYSFSTSLTLSRSFDLQTEFFYVILLYSLVFWGIIYSSPSPSVEYNRNFYHLITYGSTLGILASDNLYWTVTFMIFQIFPSLVALSQGEKLNLKKIGIFGIYQLLGIFYFLIAITLLQYQGISPTVKAIYEGHYAHNTETALAGLLILMSVFINQAIFPYHSWIRDYIKKVDLSVSMVFLLNFASFGVLYKIVLPLLYLEKQVILPVITIVTIFSAFYWSFIALSEKNLRNIFAMILSSQTALIFTGFELGNLVGKFGSFYQWLALILSIAGFGLTLMFVENRTDIRSLKTFFGLSHKAPKLGAFFFIFGFITVGLPGGMPFIGEDILFHTIIEHFPWIGIGVIATVSLNAMTIYKTFSYLFHGTNENYRYIIDLNRREFTSLIPIFVMLILFGVLPQLILS